MMSALGPFCYIGDRGRNAEVIIPSNGDPLDHFRALFESPHFPQHRKIITPREPVPPLDAGVACADIHVREALRAWISKRRSTPRIFEEFVAFSEADHARIDLAVLGRELHGFEIKSERDGLARLQRQAPVYSSMFHRVTLVVDSRHLGDLRGIPAWWGVIEVARKDDRTITLRVRRAAGRNPSLNAASLLHVLNRSELRCVLDALGKEYRKRDTRHALRERIAQGVDAPTIIRSVLICLHRRFANCS